MNICYLIFKFENNKVKYVPLKEEEGSYFSFSFSLSLLSTCLLDKTDKGNYI